MLRFISIGIILLLLLGFYPNVQSQFGGSVPGIITKATGPHYIRQQRELANVDNVLNRPLYPVDKNIERSHAANVWLDYDGDFRHHHELLIPEKRYFDFKDINQVSASVDTKVAVEAKQPYFLDEALIVERDGMKFYWDWRYPKKPLPIEFALDQDKFVLEHPNEYPSYIIKSRETKYLIDK